MTESESYTCAVCKVEYEYLLTPEEAIDQLKEEFPEYEGDTSDCAIICDPCYIEFNRRRTIDNGDS